MGGYFADGSQYQSRQPSAAASATRPPGTSTRYALGRSPMIFSMAASPASSASTATPTDSNPDSSSTNLGFQAPTPDGSANTVTSRRSSILAITQASDSPSTRRAWVRFDRCGSGRYRPAMKQDP